MSATTELNTFWEIAREAVETKQLAKLTLSKPPRKNPAAPRNLYARLIKLKGKPQLQVTYRYADREEVKNYAPEAGLQHLNKALGADYLNGDLFGTGGHTSIIISRKGNARLTTQTSHQSRPSRDQGEILGEHNRTKHRDIVADRPYLIDLGITNKEGIVLPAGKRKYKQINKFVEIIDGLVKNHPLPEGARIVDMGSGYGYLTFALYDHLVNNLGLKLSITGVEMRPNLVEKCNAITRKVGFDGLHFVEGTIDNYRAAKIDMLIALHACDTATDDALFQGLQHTAEIMVVAPCCQKQVRRDMEVPTDLKPLLNNGILLERQAAMLTDGLRALLLEREGYKTKLFEFIPLEHTAKNVMITATKARPRVQAKEEIAKLKATFGVRRHRLEELLVQDK